MNSAFFAHAAQGAMSKLGNEGKVSSTNNGGDKNGSSTDDCDPAMKQSRDIASRENAYILNYKYYRIMWCTCKSFTEEGNILATNGEFKNAIEKFTAAIKLYPGDQRLAHYNTLCLYTVVLQVLR